MPGFSTDEGIRVRLANVWSGGSGKGAAKSGFKGAANDSGKGAATVIGRGSGSMGAPPPSTPPSEAMTELTAAVERTHWVEEQQQAAAQQQQHAKQQQQQPPQEGQEGGENQLAQHPYLWWKLLNFQQAHQ